MNTQRLSRAERRRQTRTELLAAAARVFATKGFERATVDDIADAAGYTKGAVYSNFASKTDLMLALIEQRVAIQSEAVAGAFAGASLEEALRRIDAASPPEQAGREWLMLMSEFVVYAMRDDRAREMLAAEYERARTLSAAMIEEKYADSDESLPMPARDLAILIEAVGVGLGIQAVIDPAGVPMSLQAEAMRRLLTPDRPGEPSRPAKPRPSSAHAK